MAKGKNLSREQKEEFDLYQMSQELKEKTHKRIKEINYKPGIKAKNPSQEKLIQKIKNNNITFVSGPAGVGKTLIALKAAMDAMKNNEKITRLIFTKPIVEADESMGFLPGDMSEKIAPYMSSYYSNMEKLIGSSPTQWMITNKIIQEEPLNFMRGNTYDDAIMILDEAQNTTIKGLKLFISRLGENSKMIVMGDADQTDLKLKGNEKSGLQDAFERFQGLQGVTTHEFEEKDIVRNSILIEVMKRYKNK